MPSPLATRDPRQRLATLRGTRSWPADLLPARPSAPAAPLALDPGETTGPRGPDTPAGAREPEGPLCHTDFRPDPAMAEPDDHLEPPGTAERWPDSSDMADPADRADAADAPDSGEPRPVRVGGPAVAAVRRASGRLVQRWLPADAGRVRVDPGRRAAVALAAVVLLAAMVAGTFVWRSRPVPEPAPALAAAVETAEPGEQVELIVSIAGPVARPGLVHLSPGARVADALEAAGGPVPGTDLTGVNLARKLTDGEHVVVGPAAPAPPPGAAPAAGPTGSGARLDLNTATMNDLDTLPGVGPVTAQRILDWRSKHGRFTTVDQLREIDGIGEARFATLKDLVLA